jgi:hypothetical protein
VFARGSASPAIDVAFTSIRFADPSDRNFEFTPPPNATVREAVAARPVLASSGAQAGLRGAQITGTGWSRVLGVSGGSPLAEVTQGPLLGALSPVSGAWGKGRLLDSALLSVLVTTDGRIYAGAVPPADLYAAAGRK